jgi:hypothetical protein
MPRNISISSGKDFTKKIFGSVSKLRKPAFVHDGKIFSDHIFNNQRNIPLLEDNIYFINHGLPDDYQVYEQILANFNNNPNIQSFRAAMALIQSIGTNSTIQDRSIIQTMNSIFSSSAGANLDPSVSSSDDPYNNNPPPQCPI